MPSTLKGCSYQGARKPDVLEDSSQKKRALWSGNLEGLAFGFALGFASFLGTEGAGFFCWVLEREVCAGFVEVAVGRLVRAMVANYGWMIILYTTRCGDRGELVLRVRTRCIYNVGLMRHCHNVYRCLLDGA